MTSDFLSESTQIDLIRRMELLPALLKRQQEELIVRIVQLSRDEIVSESESWLTGKTYEDELSSRSWTDHDFELVVTRPLALKKFALHQFGAGVEERFLTSQGSLDEVIYSLLRVRDPFLAQKLWIRLAEGEVTFAEAAQQYSDGPEADRKGVIGPLPIGLLQPQELATWLRSLSPGELSRPLCIGEWHILLRLEKLTPAKLDSDMRSRLLQEELDSFLDERVRKILSHEPLDELHYPS